MARETKENQNENQRNYIKLIACLLKETITKTKCILLNGRKYSQTTRQKSDISDVKIIIKIDIKIK